MAALAARADKHRHGLQYRVGLPGAHLDLLHHLTKLELSDQCGKSYDSR